jgi:LytS/YehU family sensor histidine kinase
MIQHGIETTPHGARLDAHLAVHEELLFRVMNTKTAPNVSNDKLSQQDANEIISQTGLQNVRRRLALLYPHAFEMHIGR